MRTLLSALAGMALLLCIGPAAYGQASVQGTWKTLPVLMPINPVHTALMSNGKILVVSGSGNYPAETTFSVGVWDPNTNTMSLQTQTWDMFCNGMIVLPDGRPFIVGGNLQYDPFHGWKRTSIYDPATDRYVDMQDMAHGRWYPTATVLGDGRVMTFSGLTETGGTNSQVEIYKVGSGWGSPFSASFTPPLYPRMHLLPSGKVFVSGSGTQSRTFDPSTNTWSGVIATTIYGSARTYGSSVLLPLTPANSYKPKVIIFGGGSPSTATTEVIDMSAASPAWTSGPPMSQPRIEMNATLLPNGKIVTVGGSLNDEDTTTASLQSDLYDSASNTMGSAGSNAFPRLYHSVSLLLPDGTVWVAGGNPTRGAYEQHIEIYTPPYLYNANGSLATRPSITSVSPGVIGYGTSFQVQTPDAANIASVVLMKNGAVTHAFDMDQRMVGLTFTQGSGVLTVT
ncbi:MAG TPA: galactose oxidase-like domain-containing protein, partial [Candidatus Acidoferrum sp.]